MFMLRQIHLRQYTTIIYVQIEPALRNMQKLVTFVSVLSTMASFWYQYHPSNYKNSLNKDKARL